MKVRRKVTSSLLVILLLAGAALLSYPTVSNLWNAKYQSRAVEQYSADVGNLNQAEYDRLWAEAEEYNKALREKSGVFVLDDELRLKYPDMLKVGNSEAMAYVEIPAIKVKLPIYHGASEMVLQTAIGHAEWSSLPIGGEGTHSVLLGHCGLPSARLFTDLEDVKVGDKFMIHVLGKKLTYEVDKISVVEPHEVKELKIKAGEDRCTLITCTPYGVNTHRLLIHGRRVPNDSNDAETPQQDEVTSELTTQGGIPIVTLIGAALVALALLELILCGLIRRRRKSKQ